MQAPAAPADPPRALFVSWAKLRRADTIAERLGIPSRTVKYFYRGTPALLTLWKYFLQAVHTFCLLVKERPRCVLVTNPPVFALLPVWLYSQLFRARYVIDFHSGCFLEAHWRKWDRMQRFFARRAALNLIHNEDNARAAAGWGIRVLVFPSLPPVLDAPATGSRDRPLVVYICSFKSDEPVDALLEAAKGVPEADFRVTGRAPQGLRERLPANVQLTGFLSEEAYNGLLAGADVILALTTRPGTLLYGAQEAIALGKPLVLSRTPTLEAYFKGGSVFTENTPGALRDAIRVALARRAELADAMRAFGVKYRAEGEARVRELKRVVCGGEG